MATKGDPHRATWLIHSIRMDTQTTGKLTDAQRQDLVKRYDVPEELLRQYERTLAAYRAEVVPKYWRLARQEVVERIRARGKRTSDKDVDLFGEILERQRELLWEADDELSREKRAIEYAIEGAVGMTLRHDPRLN